MKQYPFTKILGWSASRYKTFKSCKRQYFYQYYTKFETENFEQLNKLKQLTTFHIEIGSLTHEIIGQVLERLQKSDSPINRQRLVVYSNEMITKYLSTKQFFEIHYGITDAIPIDKIKDKVEMNINYFLDSDRWEWIKNIPMSEREKWVVEPPGFGETRINNLKAYCKVDLLIRTGDTAFIFDWKTGKIHGIEEHKTQLLGYIHWASQEFSIDPKNIRAFLGNIYDGYSELEYQFDADEALGFHKTVEEQSKQMYAYVSDINENHPLPKERFELTTNTYQCSRCKFKEICTNN